MPSVTWVMASASSSAALAISWMDCSTSLELSTVLAKDSETFFTMSLPSRTESIECSMSSLVALAAWSDFEARLRTSSATTAKPLPAEPARAASTAAFRAKILVWNAISSMVAIILPISSEDFEILAIAATIFCI